MKKIFKILLVALSVIIALPVAFLLLMQLWFYASYPIYSFKEPVSFSGNYFYNPYAGVKADEWKKCIFHAHTKSWVGLTNGDSHHAEVVEVYKKLGFDVVSISNYMKVDTTDASQPSYIPSYEHGYGYGKTHQLVMGSDGHILWRDYFLIQNSLSQKQYTIDLLKNHCKVLALNHPDLRYGYTPADFKYLSNYDLMETFNGARSSLIYWDNAFTHGHTAWVTGNDDSHGVEKLADIQREVVYVNTTDIACDTILQQLTRGAAYIVSFPRDTNPTMAHKMNMAGKVSYLLSHQLKGDTLEVQWSREMAQITFISDSGKILSVTNNSDLARYVIQPENTYVRVALTDGELNYTLNPVVRSADGSMPMKQELGSVNVVKTILKYATIITALAVVIAASISWRRKERGKH